MKFIIKIRNFKKRFTLFSDTLFMCMFSVSYSKHKLIFKFQYIDIAVIISESNNPFSACQVKTTLETTCRI